MSAVALISLLYAVTASYRSYRIKALSNNESDKAVGIDVYLPPLEERRPLEHDITKRINAYIVDDKELMYDSSVIIYVLDGVMFFHAINRKALIDDESPANAAPCIKSTVLHKSVCSFGNFIATKMDDDYLILSYEKKKIKLNMSYIKYILKLEKRKGAENALYGS
jgi:hypothetical protein